MPYTYLCDWTWRQEALNATRIADAGYSGVFLKASGAINEGPFFTDPWFVRNAQTLTAEPRLLRGAYHYLMPGWPTAQAGLFYDRLRQAGGPAGWIAELDAEWDFLTLNEVRQFVLAWMDLTDNYPLVIYTRQNWWRTLSQKSELPGMAPLPTPHLHEAHYVDIALRGDLSRPYASHHARGIKPEWWNGYAGVTEPVMLQFTDRALVYEGSARTTASVTKLKAADLKTRLVRD